VGVLVFSVSVSGHAAGYFSTDFNNGVPGEFSGVTTVEGVQGYAGYGPVGNPFGGDFLRNTSIMPTTLTLTGLPSHTAININFLLAIIDSWDGLGNNGPDYFNVSVGGVSVFKKSFTNVS